MLLMATIPDELSRTEAVQALFDGLQQFGRALRSRSADWTSASPDLSRGDIVTLGIVARERSTRSGRVAQTLGVDPSVVSRQLAALERLGLVARCVDPADRRAELISVTELGRERLQDARTAMCEALGVRLDSWGPDAISHAASVLRDLAGLLHEHPDAPSPHARDTAEPIDSATSKEAAHA